MEFSKLIKCRESTRNYDSSKPVDNETLNKILEAGLLAPSACNNQPWRFLVISSPEMLQKIRACYHREWFKEAPHVLIVVGYRDQAWKRSFDGHSSLETDMAIAMTHLLLAAENEGVSGCWIANFDPEILKNALMLNDNQFVFGISPLGYPSKDYTKSGIKRRKSFEEVVEFI
jgi:nitroreductase